MKQLWLWGFALIMCLSFFSNSALAIDTSRIEQLRNSQQFKQLLQKANDLKSSNRKIRIIVHADADLAQLNTNDQINKGLEQLKAFASLSGLTPQKEINGLPLVVYEVNDTQLNALIASGLAINIEEDKLLEPYLAESMAQIKGSVAHNFPTALTGMQGNTASIAVLDTGVQSDHPMLTGRVISEACFSTTSSGSNSESICPSGGTAIKKNLATIGYKGTGQAAACSGLAAGISGCDHGTHVTSIAAGAKVGSVGPGVAPKANVIAIQVFSKVTSETSCGVGKSPCLLNFTSDLYNALYYVQTIANANKVASVNLSLGGGQYTATCDTDSASGSNTIKTYVDGLRNTYNVVTVAASGNSSYTNALGTPGCISTTVSVGSVSDTSDAVSSWSNSASFLDMLAPGSPIYAAVTASSYGTKSGTSMATPHVAGAFALLKGYNNAYTAAQMETLIINNGKSVTDSRNGIIKPRLDLGMMTQAVAGSTHVPTVTINQPINNAVLDRSGIVLSATATDTQDGDISANVTWKSSIDGTITSPAILTAGAHTLTATIVDSNGFTSSTATSITATNAPTTTITAPAGNIAITQGQSVTLTGTATDVENGNLSSNIQWSSNLSGVLGNGASINVSLGLGTHIITASVTDSSELTPKAPATRTVTVNANTPPTTTITAPASNLNIISGQSVTFTGTASDVQDGNLSANIQWTSSISGNLGAGASISKILALGAHTITATVTDSNGASPTTPATRTITVTCTDCDTDGMPDDWETQYSLTNPAGDEDGDTLSNLVEYQNGSNPRDAAPTASIMSPITNATFGANVAVTLNATANDTEDGDISANISWQSNQDGYLGTGATLIKSLSLGQHIITIDVTDSLGAHPISTSSITINMGIPSDINGDGKINIIDLQWLKQYLIGQKTFNTTEESLADSYPTNGDGNIDISDLHWLEKALINQ